jgi:hypothetical protein
VDLLNVLRTLRRFKWTTMTIGVLTVGAIAMLVLATPKVYQVDAAYVLVNPSVPSDFELSTHPELAAENRNNPYLRFSSQSMVGQVLATRMSSDDVRRDLLSQGVSDEYAVAPSNDFGGAGQIVQVAGVGGSPEAASAATEAIVTRMNSELRAMQKVYGAADRYLIILIPIQAPGEAKRVVSGQLRSVIAVGGVGLLILFIAISIRQAMAPPRLLRARPSRQPSQRPRPAMVMTHTELHDGPSTEPVPIHPEGMPTTPPVRARPRPLHLADDVDAATTILQGHNTLDTVVDTSTPRALP